MKFQHHRYSPAAVAAALLLCGCVTRVADVVSNDHAYLDTNFSPTTLPASVARQVAVADEPPMTFRHMALVVLTRDQYTRKLSVVQTKIVLDNAGGGLVKRLTERTQSGIPSSQYYELSYRGILPLRWNLVKLYEEIGPPIREVTEFSRFDPLMLGEPGGELHYEYEERSAMGGHSSDRVQICKIGKRHPARQIYLALAGDAVDLNCERRDDHGLIKDVSKWAYLPDYGVALQTGTEIEGAFVTYEIQTMQIEMQGESEGR